MPYVLCTVLDPASTPSPCLPPHHRYPTPHPHAPGLCTHSVKEVFLLGAGPERTPLGVMPTSRAQQLAAEAKVGWRRGCEQMYHGPGGNTLGTVLLFRAALSG